jgi:hypothetical protein
VRSEFAKSKNTATEESLAPLWVYHTEHFVTVSIRTVVVHNLAGPFKVDGNEGRVVAIGFVTVGVDDPTPVPGVVHKHNLTGLTVLTDSGKRVFYIASGRLVSASIVHENEHVGFVEFLDINQVLLNVLDIIVATGL